MTKHLKKNIFSLYYFWKNDDQSRKFRFNQTFAPDFFVGLGSETRFFSGNLSKHKLRYKKIHKKFRFIVTSLCFLTRGFYDDYENRISFSKRLDLAADSVQEPQEESISKKII